MIAHSSQFTSISHRRAWLTARPRLPDGAYRAQRGRRTGNGFYAPKMSGLLNPR